MPIPEPRIAYVAFQECEIRGKWEDKIDDAMDHGADPVDDGFYRINGMWKQRGIGKLGSKEIEHLDTIERNGKLYYSFKVNRVGRLRNSIITNNLSNIGKFQVYEKQINLNADIKRMWMGELDGINDKSNKSIPLSFNHFTLEQI